MKNNLKKGALPPRLAAELNALSYMIAKALELEDIEAAERETANYNIAFCRWYYGKRGEGEK